jgi:hypothetical protein
MLIAAAIRKMGRLPAASDDSSIRVNPESFA